MIKAPKKIAKGELVFTSFLFATSIVLLVDTANMIESNAVGFVGPKIFPFMVGGLMFLLSAIQLLLVLGGAKGEPESIEAGTKQDNPNWKSFGLVVGALVLYATFIEILGFLVMGPILYFMIGKAIGVKKNKLLALIAIILSALVFLGFTEGLSLYLPLGFDFLRPDADPDGGW